MIYIKGKIKRQLSNAIIIEANCIGYKIFIAHTEKYNLNEETKVFVYVLNVNNNNQYIGSNSENEYYLIGKLLKVKGVGIKTAIKILNKTETSKIIDLISLNKKNLTNVCY